ncbi:homocysteine-responsive endoplasmic reticulum-resident ubiquitin-like domain member 2 protein [Pieris rapae]|uniref:homocysteine-responsive endoplasmic reticulum-resident ubiquitin-like domain member 2 protein n=1 Tax=Pieris rapae TaxID=64459 RepID=UPI001E27C08C|nr:homocysteine-responsive endoplasmic reticulum-resident ubiquitin-like domain member 2 protein [Pieris rapae]
MIPDNVTLIVKAPNQQIEDQNIECQTSWTVRQLKGHLSEVYPSKPKTEEQKIIYSGQLLDDNSVLKDVLRNYEYPITHTMHLVCSSKNKMDTPEPNTDGIRNRNGAHANETAPPEMRQNDQNHTVEMQNYLSSFVNNYGRVPPYQNYNFNDRYLPMQQAYMQYMQQYANLWQAYAVNTMPPQEAPQAPAPPPAPAPQPMPEEGRDWLDNLYMASRIAVLISLLYFYGSPARLFLVFILVVTGYLHQIGFFRDLLVNPNNNLQQNDRNRVNQPPQGQEGDPTPQAAQQTPPAEQETPDPSINQNPPDDDQSLLAVTWTIFTTFFASLIPEAN